MDSNTYTLEELDEAERWSMLRAIEWGKFPLFVSQPIAPIAFLIVDWWIVVCAIVLANQFWGFVRYRFVSVPIAHFGYMFVKVKWFASLGMGL